ncbi:MAG: twin-arginine translocase subunit TatC [Novosphingobium sp.]|uniref:twin-arginine translocase subunit TatC n=1 Tax=Novosphingobium sp. TaxID=1874826 RepID=UPI0032BC5895
MAFQVQDIDETQAPLLDHLIELRSRLVRAIVALLVAFGLSLYFAGDILGFLIRPLTDAFPPGEGKLIYTKLYEAFFVELKVALFAGFFISFPIIANQLWAFIAPGLYAKEKKAFLPFLLMTPVLFTAGGAMAYYVVMPTMFTWMLGFQGEKGGLTLDALPAVGDYLGLVMQLILAFGFSFLLPVLLLLLNSAGIVSRQQLTGVRRYVIVAITAIAAVITPPDVVSQLMLLVPMWLLFEGSLIIMWLGERREAKIAVEGEAERTVPPA